jgi:hypothetical protein
MVSAGWAWAYIALSDQSSMQRDGRGRAALAFTRMRLLNAGASARAPMTTCSALSAGSSAPGALDARGAAACSGVAARQGRRPGRPIVPDRYQGSA